MHTNDKICTLCPSPKTPMFLTWINYLDLVIYRCSRLSQLMLSVHAIVAWPSSCCALIGHVAVSRAPGKQWRGYFSIISTQELKLGVVWEQGHLKKPVTSVHTREGLDLSHGSLILYPS